MLAGPPRVAVMSAVQRHMLRKVQWRMTCSQHVNNFQLVARQHSMVLFWAKVRARCQAPAEEHARQQMLASCSLSIVGGATAESKLSLDLCFDRAVRRRQIAHWRSLLSVFSCCFGLLVCAIVAKHTEQLVDAVCHVYINGFRKS